MKCLLIFYAYFHGEHVLLNHFDPNYFYTIDTNSRYRTIYSAEVETKTKCEMMGRLWETKSVVGKYTLTYRCVEKK